MSLYNTALAKDQEYLVGKMEKLGYSRKEVIQGFFELGVILSVVLTKPEQERLQNLHEILQTATKNFPAIGRLILMAGQVWEAGKLT